MRHTTKLTTSILTLIVYSIVNIGFWFFSPPALAAEKSMITDVSSAWNQHSELVVAFSISDFGRSEYIPDPSEIQNFINESLKSSSQYVTQSTRKFLDKNLPSQDQILDGINDAIKYTDSAKQFMSDTTEDALKYTNSAKKLLSNTTNNISDSLFAQNFASELDQLVSNTSQYGKKLQKIATKNLPGKLGESQQILMSVFSTITSQKLDSKTRGRVQSFLESSPEMICQAYLEKTNGIDDSHWVALQEGAGTTFTLYQTVTSAAAAGAGNLTGYAGIASAVSQLGLGGVTTTLAGVLGSNATGAAATAVVTSAVGGPVVMAGLLAGGTAVTAYGSAKLALFVADKLGEWAETSCITTVK